MLFFPSNKYKSTSIIAFLLIQFLTFALYDNFQPLWYRCVLANNFIDVNHHRYGPFAHVGRTFRAFIPSYGFTCSLILISFHSRDSKNSFPNESNMSRFFFCSIFNSLDWSHELISMDGSKYTAYSFSCQHIFLTPISQSAQIW